MSGSGLERARRAGTAPLAAALLVVAVAAPVWAAPTAVFQLAARVVTVKGARKVELRTVIKNAGREPLWVNKLFGVEEDTCRPPRTSVRILVIDKRNRLLHSQCIANPVPVAAEHYAVLAPGAEVSASSELDCFHFTPGETIRIEATYFDGAEPPPAPPGATHLADRLDAKPITFVAPP